MAAKSVGATEQTYYRSREEYGGLQVHQAKRLKDMEKENARLRKAISDLMLDKQILGEVIKDPMEALLDGWNESRKLVHCPAHGGTSERSAGSCPTHGL